MNKILMTLALFFGRTIRLLFFALFALAIWPLSGTAGGIFSGFGDFFGDTKSIAKLKVEFDLSPGDASALDWSPDGKFLAVSGILNSEVKVFDVQNKKLSLTLKKLAGGSQGIAYGPDGHFIAAGQAFTQSLKGVSIFVWDAKTGVLVKSITGPFPIDKPANSVTYLAFSPDGRYLAVGYYGNFPYPGDNIYLYDTRSWAPFKSFGDAKAPAKGGFVFSPDGQHIAHGTLSGEIRIWGVASGQLIRTIVAHSDHVESFAYSPDGKRIVSGTATGSTRGHLNQATRKFVTVKNEEQVRIFGMANDKPLRTIEGFTNSVRVLVFSREGKYLVSGSDDKTIKIWETGKWEVVGTFTTSAEPMAASFSPDNRYLAVGAGNAATVWEFKK